jgi:hypothetical protein
MSPRHKVYSYLSSASYRALTGNLKSIRSWDPILVICRTYSPISFTAGGTSMQLFFLPVGDESQVSLRVYQRL